MQDAPGLLWECHPTLTTHGCPLGIVRAPLLAELAAAVVLDPAPADCLAFQLLSSTLLCLG